MKILTVAYYIVGFLLCPVMMFNFAAYILMSDKSRFSEYWSSLNPIAVSCFEYAAAIWILISVVNNLTKVNKID